MNFTYNDYLELINSLKEHDYKICSYSSWCKCGNKVVILRHDIDYAIDKALQLARLEKNLGGVSSTFFVLLTSDFYNVFSKVSCDGLRDIINCGHDIGLHFDEVRYPELQGDLIAIRDKIIEECNILSEIIRRPVTVVSMHRPSKTLLEADLKIPGLINSYGKTFFNDFKYLSDSRRRWREPVEEIIASEQYQRLHILTHAFWYNKQEMSLKESLLSFINAGNVLRYQIMNDNFTNLQLEIGKYGVF